MAKSPGGIEALEAELEVLAAEHATSVSDLPERLQAMAGYMVGRLMLAGVIRFDDPKAEATVWQNAMTTIADCLALWPDNGDWPTLP